MEMNIIYTYATIRFMQMLILGTAFIIIYILYIYIYIILTHTTYVVIYTNVYDMILRIKPSHVCKLILQMLRQFTNESCTD